LNHINYESDLEHGSLQNSEIRSREGVSLEAYQAGERKTLKAGEFLSSLVGVWN